MTPSSEHHPHHLNLSRLPSSACMGSPQLDLTNAEPNHSEPFPSEPLRPQAIRPGSVMNEHPSTAPTATAVTGVGSGDGNHVHERADADEDAAKAAANHVMPSKHVYQSILPQKRGRGGGNVSSWIYEEVGVAIERLVARYVDRALQEAEHRRQQQEQQLRQQQQEQEQQLRQQQQQQHQHQQQQQLEQEQQEQHQLLKQPDEQGAAAAAAVATAAAQAGESSPPVGVGGGVSATDTAGAHAGNHTGARDYLVEAIALLECMPELSVPQRVAAQNRFIESAAAARAFVAMAPSSRLFFVTLGVAGAGGIAPAAGAAAAAAAAGTRTGAVECAPAPASAAAAPAAVAAAAATAPPTAAPAASVIAAEAAQAAGSGGQPSAAPGIVPAPALLDGRVVNDEQQQQEQGEQQGEAIVVSADEPMNDNDIDVEAVANEDSAGAFVHPATSGAAHGDVAVAVVEPADMAQADVGSAHHQVVSLLPASESGTAEADAAAATMVARLSVPSSSCSKDRS